MEKLKALDRRYKVCKALKWVLGIASILVAIVPPVCVAFRVAPAIPKTSVWVGVTGFAAFLLAIGLLFVIRGLNRRYGQKLPWATTCTLGSWTMWAFVTAVEKIIEQAVLADAYSQKRSQCVSPKRRRQDVIPWGESV